MENIDRPGPVNLFAPGNGSGNFDIGKKRLANLAKLEEIFDAVNKD